MKNTLRYFFSSILFFAAIFTCQTSVFAQTPGWTDLGNVVALTDINNKVGIGTTKPAGKLNVVGKSIFLGNVGIGTTDPTILLQVGSAPMLGASPPGDTFSVRQSSTANEDHLTATIVSNFSGTNALSVQGFESYTTLSHNSGNINLILPIISNVEHRSAGSISNVKLFSGAFIMNGSSGTVDKVASFATNQVVRMGGANGVINNYYGLFLDAQPTSGINNRFGIYQMGSGEKNYFAGKVGIGTTNPLFDLQVVGTASASKIVITNGGSNASAGTGTINASSTSVTVNTGAVKSNSLIFITSKTNINSPLSVSSQIPGTSFTVSVGTSQPQNVDFNWWIIDKQ